MNYLSLTNRLISARVLAVLTIVSLLMSAFPVAFFTAEAANTGITANNSTLSTEVDVQVNFVISTKSDNSPASSTDIALSDNGGGSFYTGTIAGACNSNTAVSKLSIVNNKGVCYSNNTAGVYTITVQLIDHATEAVIGDPIEIEITVNEAPVVSVPGCTDETANNFNPEATVDDQSCTYDQVTVEGCMDDTATNYDPEATEQGNAICEYTEEIPGCTDETANNFNPEATTDDQSCVYDTDVITGCMDDTATNYNPEATAADESCVYDTDETIYGCMDEEALNYDPEATAEGDVVCAYNDDEEENACREDEGESYDRDHNDRNEHDWSDRWFWNKHRDWTHLAPYCGDGRVNQDWEQCEPGEDGCTDYCTFENQCQSMQLIKITLNEDAPESSSFDGKLYLGSSDRVIPNGAWFNFYEAGDTRFPALANAVSGLAIERNQENGKLALAFVGGNRLWHPDFVQGTIETKGIDFGPINRTPNPQFKLENGLNHTYRDVFQKDGTTINFDLRATTGNDAVTVGIVDQAEDYDCAEVIDPIDPEPETYQISGYKYEVDGTTGSTSPKAGWTIYANDGSSEMVSTTTDTNGYYAFAVTAGDWQITEGTSTGWQQITVKQNDQAVEGTGACNFSITTDEQADNLNYQCDFYNQYTAPTDNSVDPVVLNGVRSSGGGGTSLKKVEPTPLVLGASTASCGMLLFDYMKIGQDNDPFEVKKLQFFLNGQGFYVPVTGYFGTLTDQAVKNYQQAHTDEILDPWLKAGITKNNLPTGWVYLLTKWKVNNTVCVGSEALPELTA